MAFDPTTPYAVACLSDSAKSLQSLTVLRQQEPPEIRVQNLVDLADSWEVEMAEEEAEQVVAEYDLVAASESRGGGGFKAAMGALGAIGAVGATSQGS